MRGEEGEVEVKGEGKGKVGRIVEERDGGNKFKNEKFVRI